MKALRPLAVAFGFLSLLPVGNRPVDEAELGRALGWFPAVGFVFGLTLASVARGVHERFPASLLAVGLVALLALLSGGLHLDGLADVFDGLGGGRGERERMLVIMRDSHIGAHGAAALVLLLLTKATAVYELLRAHAIWGLLCAPVVARWAAVPLVIFFPYARPHGLGRAMAVHGRARDLVLATVVAAACVAWVGVRVFVPTASALAIAVGLAFLMRRRLGGLTGDVYGAAIELAEVAFFVAVSVCPA
ncbi:MAG TPA: adenosylcobinamide-GDP ribazoletransferase [Polyangiaceae bacterium]